MHSASESMVRQALEAHAIDELNDNYEEESDGELEVGMAVLAEYVEDGEWYDATVVSLDEESVLVYFDEYDEYATVDYDCIALPEEEEEWEEAPLPAGSKAAAEPTGPAARSASGKGVRRPPSRDAFVPPCPASNPHKRQREALPAFAHREELLAAISAHQVVVVEGSTGCGKTTQVPQFVLEAAAAAGERCSIVCTQPRRISAMSVAERVAAERGERLGGTVGYSIRLETKSSAETCLLFCTSGILMRRLEEDRDLAGVTHVFVDEVHERSMESDFLLMVLRDLLRRQPSLRLVLMSATLDARLFADYFAHGGHVAVPAVTMPGRAFPVAALYLEDAIELVGHTVNPAADWARRGGGSGKGGGGRVGGGKGGVLEGGDKGSATTAMKPGDWLCPRCASVVFASKQACFRCGTAKLPAGGGAAGGRGGERALGRGSALGTAGRRDGANGRGGGGSGTGAGAGAGAGVAGTQEASRDSRLDGELSMAELEQRYPGSGELVHRALSALDFEVINVELVTQLVTWLSACDGPESIAAWARAREEWAQQRLLQKLLGESTPPSAKPASPRRPPPPPNPLARSRLNGRGGASATADVSAGGAPAGGAPAGGRDVRQRAEGEAADAILVFLPGLKEIQAVHEALLSTERFSREPHRSWLLPLHSMLPPEDQRKVFERPPPGVRKVVLSTNIAETSVTIDDVVFVIDCARMKEKRFDPSRRMESLDDVLVSRANAKQRRGRAGRVRPGVAFHLTTSHSYDKVAEANQEPEIRRVPLERLILTIKALKYEQGAAHVCEQLLEPPSPTAVKQAIAALVELDALELDGRGVEQLTPLGHHLAALPTDCRIGKFLLLGAIFGVTDEALTVAAILSSRSPFLTPFDKREAADEAKRSFSIGQSDHLTILNAYNHFDSRSGSERFAFARENFLGIRSLQTIAGLKRQLLELLSEAGFVQKKLRAGYVERLGRQAGGSDGVRVALFDDPEAASRPDLLQLKLSENEPLLKALLCAALYPQIMLVKEPEPKKSKGGKGGGGAPTFVVREQDAPAPVPVALHPSSINAKQTRFSSQYLVFAEKVRTGQLYVRDCSPVSPWALLLFGGALRSEGVSLSQQAHALAKGGRAKVRPPPGLEEVVLAIDGWIKVKVPAHLEALVLEVRAQLDKLLQQKIANPEAGLSDAKQGILDAVTQLLAQKGL